MGGHDLDDNGAQNAHDENDAHHHEAGIEATPRRTSSVRRLFPVLFAFVAGAMFWHLIGFWSFIDKMVFHGPRDQVAVIATTTQNAADNSLAEYLDREESSIVTRSQLAARGYRTNHGRNGMTASNCTTLSQDNPGGRIRRVPCALAGGLGTHAIITGSIGAPTDQHVQAQPADRNWATSLAITSADGIANADK